MSGDSGLFNKVLKSSPVVFGLAAISPVLAQELEPRSFNNVPIDQTFLAVAGLFSEGDLTPTQTSILQDAEMTIEGVALAISQTFDLAGDSAKFDFAGSRLCYRGTAMFRGEPASADRCEYGDPKMKLTWNFYGAPALTITEFGQRNKETLVVGTSVVVGIPVGTYDADHLINAGTNRWMTKPSIGMSKQMGRWHWELKTGVSLFEDNDDYYNGIHLEQDPLYSISGHLIYTLSRGSWLSLDANYYTGGETSKNGVDSGDRQDNSRWGLTWSAPLSRHQILKLYANTGVVTRIGNNFNTVGAAWVYRF